ncbi:dynamin family protein [Helicobacter pylori]|uniref:dynamin family protein n=1 Tax=Helicobacter pylori TaxID=210 RepID=UPI0014960CF4|nr:dynamin family protein [Helicobacter pylori]NPS34472.1 ATPase [Helicobacter pylori]
MSVNFFKGIFNNNSMAENPKNQNNHQVGLKERYDLIARILNAKMENEGLAEYQQILDNKFLEFASGVDSLKEKEIELLTLQEIKKELQLVASYPSLFQKSMVAVGGGFSAGKSSFLNNVLGLKLPIGLDKTTAIPTYCLKGEREVLMGSSQNGGVVELPDFSFDHKTLNAFDFDLKSIMPFMILSVPLPFKHLCFIDTPGYNPSNQGYTGGDRQASEEYLANAKYILWVIDCQHGTIQSDDLDYLQELYEEHGKQVFIVLNKADRKTKNDLEKIATNIREILEDKGVEICGIGAYSSKNYEKCKEINENSSIFTPLEGFLCSLDKKSEKQNEILSVLYEVHLMYERAIEQDANQFKRYQKALHSIKLDLIQKGFDDFNDDTFNKIESLKKEFSEQERSKRENLEQLNQVINLFKKSIDKVFDSVSAFTFEKYKEENDDGENDEKNYRELEEIKEMVLYFRDRSMYYLECYDLSQEKIQTYRELIDYDNELLQLDYSLKNLSILKGYKERNNEVYQADLNDLEFQNNLREWRRSKG